MFVTTRPVTECVQSMFELHTCTTGMCTHTHTHTTRGAIWIHFFKTLRARQLYFMFINDAHFEHIQTMLTDFVVCLVYTMPRSGANTGNNDDNKDTDKRSQHQSRNTNIEPQSSSSNSSSSSMNNKSRDTSTKHPQRNTSAKQVLWAKYKQLIPNQKYRELGYRRSSTPEILRELRRLYRLGYSPLNPVKGEHVVRGTRQSRSTSTPSSTTGDTPQGNSSASSTSSTSISSHTRTPGRKSRIAQNRSLSHQQGEAPPNYFALNLPSTAVHVDTVVNDLVTSERGWYGDTELVEHPNDPVVQRHYFNNIQSREDIVEAVDSVFQKQNRTCKMNVRFGLILEKEGEYQLMDATKAETTMFRGTQFMPAIKNSDDLQHHIKAGIDGDTLRDTFDYPDSDSQIAGVWQVMVETFCMSFPMGAGNGFVEDMADVDDEEDIEQSEDEDDIDCSEMEDFIVDDLSDSEMSDSMSHLHISSVLREEECKHDDLTSPIMHIVNSEYNRRRLSRFVKRPQITHTNLCFWACLAMKQGKHRKRCGRFAKTLFAKYYGDTKNINEYPGVQLSELLDIERVFKVNILLYSDVNEPRLIFHGGYKFPCENNVHLLLTGGDLHESTPLHVALVTQPDRFFKRVTCTSCGKIFTSDYNMRRHLRQSTCDTDREVFVKKASVYTPRENQVRVFLRKWNKPKRMQHDPFTRYYASFDYESMLLKIPQPYATVSTDVDMTDSPSNHSNSTGNSPKRSRVDPHSGGSSTRYLSEHIPVSVSIQSNVPGFEGPKFIFNKDPFQLNQEFYEYLTSTYVFFENRLILRETL